MDESKRLRSLLDERGIEHFDYDANKQEGKPILETQWKTGDVHATYTEYPNKGHTTRLVVAWHPTPEQAIAVTVGGAMTLDEATEYAERFMGDYAKVLLESTLFIEYGKPTNQHAFEIAERKEAQMARTLAEALSTAGVGTCKLVDNDSGPDMHCTACGGGVDDEYRYFMDSWGYSRCPHCGARIIEEETE